MVIYVSWAFSGLTQAFNLQILEKACNGMIKANSRWCLYTWQIYLHVFISSIILNSTRDSKSLHLWATFKASHSRIVSAGERSWWWVLTKRSWESLFFQKSGSSFHLVSLFKYTNNHCCSEKKSWIGDVSKWSSYHSFKFMTQQVLQTRGADKFIVHS